MISLVAAACCLIATASPVWGLDGAVPGCSEPTGCPAEPKPSDADESSEVGSLLQVHRSPSAQVADDGVAPALSNGCPNSLTWALIETAARVVFKQTIKDYLPFHANHTWTNQPFAYAGCNGTVTGFAKMSADADLSLGSMKCVSATCSKKSWGVCSEYYPIAVSVTGSANTLTFEASADGEASWGAGCVNGSGSAALKDGKTSFTVVRPTVSATGTMDLTVRGPTISSPNITSASIGYDSFTDVQCSMDGQPIPACVNATDHLNTDEFKEVLAKAITKSLGYISDALADLLKEQGISFEQLATGQAELHPRP